MGKMHGPEEGIRKTVLPGELNHTIGFVTDQGFRSIHQNVGRKSRLG